ncbi:MAG: hypothetical protein EBY81_03920, partial [Verrucomicrobia bacterium]|nr:hypothetical protein [Verrucomicrobiota bacterium]
QPYTTASITSANANVMTYPGGNAGVTKINQVSINNGSSPVKIELWYNSSGSTMNYTSPATGGTVGLLNNTFVMYAGNVLVTPSATGSTMATSVTTTAGTTAITIGKLSFVTSSGNPADFIVDDIYVDASAPSGANMTISSPTTATAQAGYFFSYPIGTSGGTATSYDATGLPSYLTINKTSGVISGIVPIDAATGALSGISLSATGLSTATGILTLTITTPPNAAPAITSVATASGNLTKAFTYQIATSTTSPSSTPTSYAIATGILPAGLALNTTTGAITGTPTELTPEGGTQITYTATNPFGTSNAQTLTITINPAPVFAWNNSGTVWTNAASWTNNAVPANSAAGDIAAFGNLGASATSVDVGTGRSIGGIVFNSGAYAYTWTGTDITVGNVGGITNNSTATQTFGNKILNTGGDTIWSSVSSGSLVFNGAIDLSATGVNRKLTITGAGNVTVNGVIAKTLRLNGANTYTGATEVADGTMILSAPNSSLSYKLSGYDTNISPVLKVSATNAMSSSASVVGSSTLSKTGTLEFATNGSYTLNQYNIGNMNFTNSSGSPTTLTFTNSNNTLSSGGSRTLANQSTDLTVTFSGQLDIGGSTNDTCSISTIGPVVISNRVYNSSTNYTRGLVKSGPNSLTIYGTNSYNGTTTVSGGTLRIPAGGSLVGCGDTIVKGSVTTATLASLNLGGAAGVVQVSTNG